MTRKALPRLLAAAVTLAAIVAALSAVAGTGFAQTAAQAAYAPTNTAPPSIGGNPNPGQTLTAAPGTWNSDTTPTFTYQWMTCDSSGNACTPATGATQQTYSVKDTDTGKTLRVAVTATNPSGSSSATSSQTPAISQTGPAGAIKLSNGQTSIPATSVTLPERLIVNGVKFSPSRLTTRNAFTGRFHVVDTRGFVVRDVLVKVTGLPYSWARSATEVRTDQSGWATLTIVPTRNLPLGKRAALVMFVRARIEGQSLLAGSSTRRLVQVTVR
jgi:hypothetical protein